MANGTVDFQIFGSAAAAEKAIVGLEKKYDDLQNKIRATSRISRQASDQSRAALDSQSVGAKLSESSLVSLIARMGTFAAAAKAMQTAIGGAMDKNREWSRSTDEVVKKHDEGRLKMQIQGGFSDRAVKSIEGRMRKALSDTPSTDMAGAYDIMTQIASSGFKKDDITSGKALRTILDLNAATTMFGRDVASPKDSALAISQFLKGTGTAEPSAEMIRNLGGQITQLFNKSDLQFPHLKELAGEAASLTGMGVSPQQQLAAFATLVDVKPAPEAATGLRQLVTDLATAGASKDKVKALQAVGLKPQDVDLVGEDLPQALQRLQGGLATKDRATQNQIMVRLFGERTLSSAQTLMGQMPKFQDLESSLQGNDFEKAVFQFQESRYAKRARTSLMDEFAKRDADSARGELTWEEVRNQADQLTAQRRVGASPGQQLVIGLSQFLAQSMFSLKEGLGQSPGDAGIKRTGNERDVGLVLQQIEKNTRPAAQRGPVNRNAQQE